MASNILQELRSKIHECYSIDLSKVNELGFDSEVLIDMEKKLGRRLPNAYFSFMTQLGTIYAIFCGEDCVQPIFIEENQRWFTEILQKENSKINPLDSFVFAVHEGYEYWYIKISDLSEDPVVFLYQSWGNLIDLNQNLSEFVKSEILRKIDLAMRSPNFFDFTKSLLLKLL